MRIAYVLPGSGDSFYCQNCVRDITLVKALRARGHDVVLVPLYLPLFADGQEEADDAPVFFGGLSTYLQQKYSIFRKTPRWLDRILDSRFLLRSLARFSGSTQASELGKMTISMLKGEEGNQAKEVKRLVAWLADTIKPDIVHLSTSLLLGIVPSLRAELDLSIVCSLQDEDLWIDAMKPEDADEVWKLTGELATQTDTFVAASNYYAKMMSAKMDTPQSKMEVVYPGIPFEEYGASEIAPDPPVIGFLSKLTSELGVELLVKAFLELKQDSRWRDVRLRITGGRTSDDRKMAARLGKRVKGAGFGADVEFIWEFDRASRIAFLQSLSLMSVPSVQGEAFGLHIVESLACGVPVVQPRAGAYVELVDASGGGLLVEPGSVQALVDGWTSLLSDSSEARKMGMKGREAAGHLFSTDAVASGMIKVYETVYAKSS